MWALRPLPSFGNWFLQDGPSGWLCARGGPATALTAGPSGAPCACATTISATRNTVSSIETKDFIQRPMGMIRKLADWILQQLRIFWAWVRWIYLDIIFVKAVPLDPSEIPNTPGYPPTTLNNCPGCPVDRAPASRNSKHPAYKQWLKRKIKWECLVFETPQIMISPLRCVL